MASQNAAIKRERDEKSSQISALKRELEKSREEKMSKGRGSDDVDRARKGEGCQDGEGDLGGEDGAGEETGRWRTEMCVSPLLGKGVREGEKGVVVKVMICNRCFGTAARCEG
jgi:hypothetical protein